MLPSAHGAACPHGPLPVPFADQCPTHKLLVARCSIRDAACASCLRQHLQKLRWGLLRAAGSDVGCLFPLFSHQCRSESGPAASSACCQAVAHVHLLGLRAWGVWQEPCTPSADYAIPQQPVAHVAYGAHGCSRDERRWAGCADPMCLFPLSHLDRPAHGGHPAGLLPGRWRQIESSLSSGTA